MVRRLSALAALATTALAAAASAGAGEHPGKVEGRIAALGPNENVQEMAVTPDGRIVTAGWAINGPAPGFNDFVRVYRAEGGLDPGFGTGGEVYLEGYQDIAAMTTDSAARILVAQAATLRRLNQVGSPDASFGTGGEVHVDFSDQGASWAISDLLVDHSGRILIAGSASPGQSMPGSLVLARYLPDGAPDAGFGTNGRTVVPVGSDTGAPALALQPDGRIVVAAANGNQPPVVGRLSPDGQIDEQFGRGGFGRVALVRRHESRDLTAPASSDWRPLTLAHGRIRVPVASGVFKRGAARIGVIGLTANGHVDRHFGRRGLALGPRRQTTEGGEFPEVAVADSHGSILVAGSAALGDDLSGDDATALRRFRRNGTLDRTFGRRGIATGTLGSSSGAFEQQLAMLDADTVVLAEEDTTPKYQRWHGGALTAIDAGYDRTEPAYSVRSGCHWLRIRIRDDSPLDRLVVRFDGQVVRRTTRKRLRLRVRPGLVVSFTAVDAGGNRARAKTTVPPC